MNNPVTENELIERSAAPRVTKDALLANIKKADFYVHHESCLTICILTLMNGFTVTGQSACADPANFKVDIGERLAREDAEKKIWAFMGYMLKEELYRKDLTNHPNAFLQRMKIEQDELKEKINKLNLFIEGNVQFNELDDANQQLLMMQRAAMRDYETTLAQRIILNDK